MKTLSRLILLFCIGLGIVLPFDPSKAASREWIKRVDAWVLETAATGETEFIVYLKEQADLRTAYSLSDKLSKTTFVVQTLQATADRSQRPIQQILETMGVEYRSYWVANILWVRGGMQTVQVLANRPEIAHLYANPTVKLDELQNQVFPAQTQHAQGIEWNLQRVNADKVWSAGYRGQGVVIGGADTGYQWDHPALKQQYRGWNGQTVDHNYNWHDAIHGDNPHTSPGNPCGFDAQQPCDDYGHGTHTMGIIVGDDGAGNQIGVAPGARWIGCRNMEQGWGSPATYIECYQWFMAPTDLNGMNPDPTKAPHVINNSWGCPPEEGCEDLNVLRQVVENVRAAGILTVHSAGNQGPACATIRDPAAIYDASLTVGNTTALDGLNTSSSRGPVISDGSGRLKPDVVAPGSFIRSSYPTNTYTYLSGTSMAAPHVVGMAALLISANPALAGKIDMLEHWITQTANPISIPLETCGGIPSTTIPNNSFGWGRINAWEPFNRRLHLNLTAVPSAVRPGGMITYTLTVSNFHPTDTAHSLILTDTVPAKTVFLNATSPYELINNTLRWERAELMPGADWAVQLVVLNAGLPGTQIVNNHYDLSSQGDWFYTFREGVRTPILFDFFFPVLIRSSAP